MRIVYLSNSIIPSRMANSIQVVKMCSAFAGEGHEVTLVCPENRTGNDDKIRDLYRFYDVKKNFHIFRICPPAFIKGKSIIYGIGAALYSRYVQPDLIYGRDVLSCFFAALTGLPTIFESHMPVDYLSLLAKQFFRMMIRLHSFRKLVVISHALRRFYETNYPLLKDCVHVAPDGADPVKPDVEPFDLKATGNAIQAVYVGHLYPGKGMELISELAPMVPWVQFNIVGGHESDIQFWRSKTKGTSNIRFWGFFPPSQVASVLRGADVLLAPFQGQISPLGEGNIADWTSPLKIFEYMSAGKPIISSDLPVLLEVLRHEHNALVCPPKKCGEWARAITWLAENPRRAEVIAIQAKADFDRKYSWAQRVRCILGDWANGKNWGRNRNF